MDSNDNCEENIDSKEQCTCDMRHNHNCAPDICKYDFEPNDMMNNNANQATMEEMYNQLKCLRFAIIELSLYLDTHPDNKKAICMHNEYTKKFRILSDQYQKFHGPLSIMYPCKKWRWLEKPWPWEGGCR